VSQHRNDPEPNGLDDRFADWVDGRLDEQARRELEAELSRDPELHRQAEEYRATVQMVREHLTAYKATHQAHEEPPADLVTGVLQRVRRERSPLFRLVPLVASLSAAAALVLTVFLLNQSWNRGTDPLDDHNRSNEVAKYEVQDEEDRSDDMALKAPPRSKAVAGEKKPAETLDRTPRFKSAADPKLAKKSQDKSGRDAKQQAAAVVETEDEEQEVVEARKQAARAKDVAQVADDLHAVRAPSKVPTPGAPTQPAEPGAGAEQRARAPRPRGRMGGRGGQTDKDLGDQAGIQRRQERQLTELRRITAQVFPTPQPGAQTKTRTLSEQDGYDSKELAQKPRLDAGKQNKADDTKLVEQVPVVVVQLAGPPASGLGAESQVRQRAVGGKQESRKEQQQVAQNFLGYLQQQPLGAGNLVLGQARAVDVTRTLAKLQADQAKPQADQTKPQADPAKPQTGGGAGTFQSVLQPGDQLLLVTGSSREVQTLFQQLKAFLGRPKDVAVQQLPPFQLPGGTAAFGARRHALEKGLEEMKKQNKKAAEEMHFYLVLRDAAPATRPRASRR